MGLMTALRKPVLLTPEEYLAIEETALEKSEFFQGRMYAMSGASFAHNRLNARLITMFENGLSKSRCSTCGPDMRIYIPATGLFTYPDLVVVCGEPEFALFQTGQTLANPVLIVEILSPSTEDYDRTVKFDNYQTVESLREYILVSQSAPKLRHYSKQPGGQWLLTILGEGNTLNLPALNLSIPVAAIYEDIPLSPARRFRVARKASRAR